MADREATAAQSRSKGSVTPRARGEERRKVILQTAMNLFSGGGFHSVSLADIAKEVGITQAGILHYFPTKAALLLAVLQQREEQNAASQQAREAAGATPLEAYVGMLSENDRQPELVQLFVILAAESTAEEHPGHEWFKRRNERMLRKFGAYVQDAVDVSKLPAGVDVETLTRWLLALSHGLGSQWVYAPGSFDRAGSVGLFLEVLRPYMRGER